MNNDLTNTNNRRDIYSVSRLLRETKSVLEGSFPLLWLEGEISNLSRPSSGHIYFSLKDVAGQIRCAMFRGRKLLMRFKPENGLKVLVRARITLYEARGDFQIIIEQMEEAGLGELQRNFDALKDALGREGLFNSEHKQTLPTLPKRIGIITSPTGAAVRDIISVLKRRFPGIPVLIYPTSVQGAAAKNELIKAIKLADKRKDCDLLILARGGGSLEDLWAFNEEIVARAIHRCSLPIITGIGHEVDFTIADFVADMRAPTPSAAAELVTPNRSELLQQVEKYSRQLRQQLRNRFEQNQQQLTWLAKRLQQQHPGRELQNKAQRLDELELRFKQSFKQQINHHQHRLVQLENRLQRHSPSHQLKQTSIRLQYLHMRLTNSIKQHLGKKNQQLSTLAHNLNNVSPLATMQRGYAIIQDSNNGNVIRSSEGFKPGDKITARLGQGQLHCCIDKVENKAS